MRALANPPDSLARLVFQEPTASSGLGFYSGEGFEASCSASWTRFWQICLSRTVRFILGAVESEDELACHEYRKQFLDTPPHVQRSWGEFQDLFSMGVNSFKVFRILEEMRQALLSFKEFLNLD